MAARSSDSSDAGPGIPSSPARRNVRGRLGQGQLELLAQDKTRMMPWPASVQSAKVWADPPLASRAGERAFNTERSISCGAKLFGSPLVFPLSVFPVFVFISEWSSTTYGVRKRRIPSARSLSEYSPLEFISALNIPYYGFWCLVTVGRLQRTTVAVKTSTVEESCSPDERDVQVDLAQVHGVPRFGKGKGAVLLGPVASGWGDG